MQDTTSRETSKKKKSSQKETTQLAMTHTPSTATGSPLKHSMIPEWLKPQKKAKESKTNSEVITLTEGDLNDIEKCHSRCHT